MDNEEKVDCPQETRVVSEQSGKLNKQQKKNAILWGIAFLVVAFLAIQIYPRFSYLLPWNAQKVECPLPVTATTQQEAFDQGEIIVRAKVESILLNQYDANSGIVYSLVKLNITEVLRGEGVQLGTGKNTIQYGGKYRNVTYIYPETINYTVGNEYIIIANRNFNPIGDPYSKLVVSGDKCYGTDNQSYTLDQIRQMITASAAE